MGSNHPVAHQQHRRDLCLLLSQEAEAAAEPAKPTVPTMEDFQGLKAAVMDLQDEVTRLRSMRRRATKETEVSEDV